MEIQQAQQKVDELIKTYGGYWEPLSMMARITEEVGELARAYNLKYGGKKSKFSGDGREIKEEMADVLLTILAMANEQGIDIEKELKEKIEKDFKKMKGVYIKDGN